MTSRLALLLAALALAPASARAQPGDPAARVHGEAAEVLEDEREVAAGREGRRMLVAELAARELEHASVETLGLGEAAQRLQAAGQVLPGEDRIIVLCAERPDLDLEHAAKHSLGLLVPT